MSTEDNVYKQRINNWKRAAILFMSTTVALIVALYVFSGDFHETAETTVEQVEIIEQLQTANALLEKRTLENEIIMLLNTSTVDKWSIHKRKGKDYDMFLTKGDVSVWATEDNLLETIEWLANAPVAKEE